MITWSALIATLALAQPTTTTVKEEPITADHDVKVEVGMGAISGAGVRSEGGAVLVTAARWSGHWEGKRWGVRVPLALSHRQSLGFALAETKARLALQADWTVGPVTLDLAGRGGFTWRPDWSDPYQPTGDGELAATSRHSFGSGSLEGGLTWRVSRDHKLELSSAMSIVDYLDDPTFDPVNVPTHLAPADHRRAGGEIAWKIRTKPARLKVGLEAEARSYVHQFARDAGTGRTHATSDAPNPTYKRIKMEPYLNARIPLGPDSPVTLRVGAGVEVQRDLFQGYYSYLGAHPSIGLDVDSGKTHVRLRTDLSLRQFGPDSYEVGQSHPELSAGERRAELMFTADLGISYQLKGPWALYADAGLRLSRTNFPDYVPGVFPASASYDIQWNYTRTDAVVGARYAW